MSARRRAATLPLASLPGFIPVANRWVIPVGVAASGAAALWLWTAGRRGDALAAAGFALTAAISVAGLWARVRALDKRTHVVASLHAAADAKLVYELIVGRLAEKDRLFASDEEAMTLLACPPRHWIRARECVSMRVLAGSDTGSPTRVTIERCVPSLTSDTNAGDEIVADVIGGLRSRLGARVEDAG